MVPGGKGTPPSFILTVAPAFATIAKAPNHKSLPKAVDPISLTKGILSTFPLLLQFKGGT